MNVFYMKDAFVSTNNLPSAGEIFYEAINKAIQENENMVVDMSGVSSLPSIFLNVSVGRIIEERGKEDLRAHVSFIKITKKQAARLKEYFSRYN